MKIKGEKITMLKLGLIGYPLSHSLSPVIHKAAMTELGIKGDYMLLGTPPDKLKNMVEFIKKSSFKGFNVTIPHKVKIMDYLDCVDKLALRIEAVNTVVIEENKTLTGHNTDVYGFIYAIPSHIRHNLNGKKAVIIGSGGAARAVTAGMCEIGIKTIEIITLESEIINAYDIRTILNKNFRGVEVLCSPLTEKVDLSGTSLVVNATPVGMEGKYEGMSPISQFSLDSLAKNAVVYDIVYKPLQTKLLEMAEKRGLLTLTGLDMLILQGARSFFLWTGLEAPVDVMRQAVTSGLA